jgi:hypothetical protein
MALTLILNSHVRRHAACCARGATRSVNGFVLADYYPRPCAQDKLSYVKSLVPDVAFVLSAERPLATREPN